MKRIKLNGGHASVCIEGRQYMADDEGCLILPDEVAVEMMRVHGGELAPGPEVLMDRAEQADTTVAHLKAQLEIAVAYARKTHEDLDVYVAKSKAASDAKKASLQKSPVHEARQK